MYSVIVYNSNKKPAFGFITADIDKALAKHSLYAFKYPTLEIDFRVPKGA